MGSPLIGARSPVARWARDHPGVGFRYGRPTPLAITHARAASMAVLLSQDTPPMRVRRLAPPHALPSSSPSRSPSRSQVANSMLKKHEEVKGISDQKAKKLQEIAKKLTAGGFITVRRARRGPEARASGSHDARACALGICEASLCYFSASLPHESPAQLLKRCDCIPCFSALTHLLLIIQQHTQRRHAHARGGDTQPPHARDGRAAASGLAAFPSLPRSRSNTHGAMIMHAGAMHSLHTRRRGGAAASRARGLSLSLSLSRAPASSGD